MYDLTKGVGWGEGQVVPDESPLLCVENPKWIYPHEAKFYALVKFLKNKKWIMYCELCALIHSSAFQIHRKLGSSSENRNPDLLDSWRQL